MSLHTYQEQRQQEAETASKRFVKAQRDGNSVAAWTALHDWGKATGNSVLVERYTYTLPSASLT